MTIGINLSPLQSPHRMRGIGSTLLNFINNISIEDRKTHTFVFYVLPLSNNLNPIKLLDTSKMKYEIRTFDQVEVVATEEVSLFHKLNRMRQYIQRCFPSRIQHFLTVSSDKLLEIYDHYMRRVPGLTDLDVYLQTDPNEPTPSIRNVKVVIIVYDIIPYVLEWDYLWSYHTARIRGRSRKNALRKQALRWAYIIKMKINVSHADLLLAISEHTSQDFQKYLNVSAKKIKVTPLGAAACLTTTKTAPPLKSYHKTAWGYISRSLTLQPDMPFILYIGGADRRRRLDDLVTAFNGIRARGIDLKLILVGDSMQGPENIATDETRHALKSSSYIDDIIFMGFVDDLTRDWLYHQAVAFIFPSKYEGFGLPVLEAMVHECPVICYKNPAVFEVTANAPIYVSDAVELGDAVVGLLNYSPNQLTKLRRKGVAQTKKYSWSTTSSSIIAAIVQPD